MTEPGSRDDRPVKIVDVAAETVMAVLVFPNGSADVRSSLPPEKAREVLLQLADTFGGGTVAEGDHVCGPECAPASGNKVIPQAFIEMTRSEVDGMVDDLQHKAKVPPTTEHLALTLSDSHGLPDRQHLQALCVMAAILLQRAAYQ